MAAGRTSDPTTENSARPAFRVHWVNRGGGCVLHTPGQLVAYLALPLKPFDLNVQAYLDRLNDVVVGVLAEFDLKGQSKPGHSGVFLDNARVASVGVAVNRWIAYHGLTLNVGPTSAISTCWRSPAPTRTCCARRRWSRDGSARPRCRRSREALIRRIETAFGLEQHHVYTDHPLIRRKTRPHVYVPSLG